MSTSIADLQPGVMLQANKLIKALDARGILFAVTSTRRTQLEQVALYAQGRGSIELVQVLRKLAGLKPLAGDHENVFYVTRRDGVNTPSDHQLGLALDIVPLDNGRPSWNYRKMATYYLEIAAVARGLGWTCGIDWKPVDEAGLGVDPPHYAWLTTTGAA